MFIIKVRDAMDSGGPLSYVNVRTGLLEWVEPEIIEPELNSSFGNKARVFMSFCLAYYEPEIRMGRARKYRARAELELWFSSSNFIELLSNLL